MNNKEIYKALCELKDRLTCGCDVIISIDVYFFDIDNNPLDEPEIYCNSCGSRIIIGG